MESSANIAEKKPSQKRQEENTEVSNEEPEKKIIKLSELSANNLDPVEYFSCLLDIPEMILQHLSGRDLINASEVSPISYNFIASSKNLMKNIKIVFNRKRKLQQEDCELLKNSSRQYQNIEVQRSYKGQRAYYSLTEYDCISPSERDFIFSKARDWKSVCINETYFKEKSALWEFLSSIESSVESFSVCHNIYRDKRFPFDDELSSNFESFEVLSFPKLKHLKMDLAKCSSIGEIYAKFFINAVAIEKLEFKDDRNFNNMTSALPKMLENFKKLTNLTLETKLIETFEDECWERFQFKLKSLTLSQERSPSQNLKFLESQNNNLEELTITAGQDKEIFKAIMKMPKLKSLELFGNIPSNYEVPDEISTSITDLKLRHSDSVGTLHFLLKSMPNVKRISFYIFPVTFNTQIYQFLLRVKVGSWIDVDRKEFEEFMICNYKR